MDVARPSGWPRKLLQCSGSLDRYLYSAYVLVCSSRVEKGFVLCVWPWGRDHRQLPSQVTFRSHRPACLAARLPRLCHPAADTWRWLDVSRLCCLPGATSSRGDEAGPSQAVPCGLLDCPRSACSHRVLPRMVIVYALVLYTSDGCFPQPVLLLGPFDPQLRINIRGKKLVSEL